MIDLIKNPVTLIGRNIGLNKFDEEKIETLETTCILGEEENAADGNPSYCTVKF